MELPIKTKEIKKAENNSVFIENYDLDDDAEVKSTLKSAHQAEWLFGYHGYAAGGYRGANEAKDYGKYVRQIGYTNGSKGNPWQDDHLRYGDDWWENWMSFTDKNKSDEDPTSYAYDHKLGHGHRGFRCKKPKNLKWWRELEKDNGA